MIKTQQIVINDINFVYNYSDSGKYIMRDGKYYKEAYDLSEFNYTYEETDRLIPEPKTTSDDILNILLGGEET